MRVLLNGRLATIRHLYSKLYVILAASARAPIIDFMVRVIRPVAQPVTVRITRTGRIARSN